MRSFGAVATFLLLLFPATPLLGWGEKGHAISSEAAAHGLPAEMPGFFHRAYPSLVYLSYDPDRWRGAGESFDASNSSDHFLDYEYVAGLELSRDRYKFVQQLSDSGRLKRFGISNTTAGFVPWRIAEMSELLTNQWRLWRASRPGSTDREQIEQNIIFLSGTLGHFVADSANPHHASIHYNGWADADNPNNYANDCDVHSRFESIFVNQALELADVIPRLRPAVLRADAFTVAIDLIRDSLSHINTIYTLDRDQAFVRGTKAAEGKAFAADRMAAGASLLRDLWWSTYKNSERRPERRRS
ncbi:MAG TPA: hypothetical protein VNM92_01330 [Thermoanaerobaculia bacterium]|nr:hypothetical protein [Thermoanaerobaculia bacterium]